MTPDSFAPAPARFRPALAPPGVPARYPLQQTIPDGVPDVD